MSDCARLCVLYDMYRYYTSQFVSLVYFCGLFIEPVSLILGVHLI